MGKIPLQTVIYGELVFEAAIISLCHIRHVPLYTRFKVT